MERLTGKSNIAELFSMNLLIGLFSPSIFGSAGSIANILPNIVNGVIATIPAFIEPR